MNAPLSSVKVSCEFFPANTRAGRQKLYTAINELSKLNNDYYSVTYGAGGATQDGTLSLVDALRQEYSAPVVPHITCIAANLKQIDRLLDAYRVRKIDRIMALRGDIPSGYYSRSPINTAELLVRLIREKWGDGARIYVAAYPEKHPKAASFAKDIDHFVDKCKAGANEAITQYFFNSDAYFSFVDSVRSRGIDVPIIPGIMPITNYSELAAFSDNCGTEIPRWVRQRLADYQNDLPSLRAFGLDVVTQLCEKLIAGGAPGLHFYTMNRSDAILPIAERLNLIKS